MRKFLVLAVAAAAAALLVPISATAAPTARHHVLTIGKPGGTAVKVGATLTAGLKPGTTAEFVIPGGEFVKCKSVSFTARVTNNPTAKGTADEKLTAQTYKRCSTNISVANGVPSVKLTRLPYKTTLSDSGGDPVTVSGTTATISVPATIGGTLHCQYTANKGKTRGSASNASQTISFTRQPFHLISGPQGCPTSGKFSATFGPVKDSSVHGSPHVYVN